MPKIKPPTTVFDAVFDAPFGHLGLRSGVVKGQEEAGDMLLEIVYVPRTVALQAPRSALLQKAAQQLTAYYHNPRSTFDLPIAAHGTAFQQRVWGAISAIPCGGYSTYGTVAKAIRSAPRAVGQACGANPFPILVPCHRVLAASGLGGFAHHSASDFYLGVKRWLLQHEGVLLPE